jgi:gluconokinase
VSSGLEGGELRQPPVRVVVMGVSGAGKSLIGAALSQALHVAFVEGDEFHPPANVKRMANGIPLTDADRDGWLRALALQLRVASDAGVGLVVSCSALKRSYRDVLRSGAPAVRFILLLGTEALLRDRLAGRTGHFMPSSLLTSQLATIELPSTDENAIMYSIDLTPDTIVRDALTQLLGEGLTTTEERQ